jgi:hypothetical protein
LKRPATGRTRSGWLWFAQQTTVCREAASHHSAFEGYASLGGPVCSPNLGPERGIPSLIPAAECLWFPQQTTEPFEWPGAGNL